MPLVSASAHSRISSITIFLILLSIIPSVYSFDYYKSRLAIDYGPRFIGIATSLGRDINPVSTISNHGNLSLISGDIINIARKTGAVEIIVGVPLDKDGTMKYTVRNLNGILCLNFSSVLSCICNKAYPKASVLLMDERYSTREAKEKSKLEYARSSLDAVTAACLLERYIEDQGSFNVLPALPCAYPPSYDIEYFDYSIVSKYIQMLKGGSNKEYGGGSYDGIGNKKVGSL
jgi:RNase H-fold protein (predicted Holliday junction resolvase)